MTNIEAQQRCSTNDKMDALFEKDPAFHKSHQQLLKQGPYKATQKLGQQDVITIPVHVIIVHPPGEDIGTGDNLSLERINSQIDVLNEDFRMLNSNSDDTPDEFPTADCMIEFCLANKDEDGNDTDGVTRYATNDNFDDNEFQIKAATGWDRDDYMNVWVAPTIDGLGYAYLPTPTSLPNATLDGLAVLTEAFGGPGYGELPPYDLGRTATHEAGHYLGLRHVWGNGGCGSDDNIEDTPTATSEYYGCPTHPSPSCNSNDMFMNYMDYVDDDCMTAFTPDQSDYMNNILNTSRSSLLDAAADKCDTNIPELSGEITALSDVTCFGGSNGFVTVIGIDGVPPYEYSLDGGPFGSGGTFFNLSAGDYVVTIRDAADQTFDVPFTISQPDELIVIELSHTDVSCFGEQDGTATLSAFGGTEPYEYAVDNEPYGNNNVFTNLSAGLHTFLVRDVNGCTSNLDIFIDEPQLLEINIATPQDISCFGANDGSVLFGVTGGTPGYTVILDGSTPVNSNEVDSLTPGIHTLSVTDINNCFAFVDFTIDEPSQLSGEVTGKLNLTCFEDSTGMISLVGMDGTPGYSYKYQDGNYQSDSVFQGLAAGNHVFTIKDQNDCELLITDNLSQPDLVAVQEEAKTDPICFEGEDGTIEVSGSGGSGPLSYHLGNESNDNGFFEMLTAGDYNVIARDSNQCEGSTLISLSQPDELVITIVNQTEAGCDGLAIGSIDFDASGGTGAFQYTFLGITNSDGRFSDLPSGTYQVEVEDEIGCVQTMDATIEEPVSFELELIDTVEPECFGDPSGQIAVMAVGKDLDFTYSLDGENFGPESIFQGLTAGEYIITAKDQNNCKQEISVVISEPSPILLSTEVEDGSPICFDESTGIFFYEIMGGTPPYKVFLDDQEILNPNGSVVDLRAGIYSLIVEDANDCQTEEFVELLENPEITLTADPEGVYCASDKKGTVQLNASGGAGDFIYDLAGNINQNGTYDDLEPGIYSASVIDINGCIQTVDFEVIEEDELETDDPIVEDVACFGGPEGRAEILAYGGNAPLTYDLVGIESNQTGIFELLPAGDYTVNISDGVECTASVSFEITQPDELIISEISVEDESGSADGSVTVNVIGGSPPYSYSLDDVNYSSNNVITDLSKGNYTLFVRDSNGCLITIDFSVDLVSSIKELISLSKAILYPNPTSSELFLEIQSDVNQTLSMQIRSSEGKLVQAKELAVISGTNRIEMDTDNLSAGIYFVRLQNEEGIGFLSFIKQD